MFSAGADFNRSSHSQSRLTILWQNWPMCVFQQAVPLLSQRSTMFLPQKSPVEGPGYLYKPTSVFLNSVSELRAARTRPGLDHHLAAILWVFYCELWCTLKNPTKVICGYDFWTSRPASALKIPTRGKSWTFSTDSRGTCPVGAITGTWSAPCPQL